jgi:hypothetical protein
VNQKLIAQYSDKGPIGQNLGDLLKAALAEKGAGEEEEAGTTGSGRPRCRKSRP